MKSNIMKKVDELFKEGEPMTLPKIEAFVREALGFFEHLRSVLANGTPEEKEEALKTSQELQEKLQSASSKMLESVHMSPEMMNKFVNPSNFNPDDWRQFQKIQHEIDDYQKTIQPAKKIEPPKKHKGVWKEKI